jgi:hypothetical protein
MLYVEGETRNTGDIVEHKEENRRQIPMTLTPVRSGPIYPRTIHTISKVPLRPDGDGSALKIPKKRSRSLSSGRRCSTPTLCRSKTTPSLSPSRARNSDPLVDTANSMSGTEFEVSDQPCEKITDGVRHTVGSPANSPGKAVIGCEDILQGAVVYVDVHTAEGADASGIFVELLGQMGARCVKSWTWNPRASLSPVNGMDPKEGKVGITHVVFKDGGVRTLEKVREANGLVRCVGVGWVLE